MTLSPETSTAAAARGYEPPTAVRWGLKQAAAGLAAFIVVLVAANLLVLAGVIVGSDAAQFALSLVGYGVLVATVMYASRRLGQRSLARDFWLRMRAVDLAIGLGIGLLAKLIGIVWGAVGIVLFGVPVQQSNLTLSGDTLWLVLNGIVMAAIVAPFVEELFMRGLVMHAIRNAVLRRRGRPQPAPAAVQRAALLLSIGGSALLFMALHLYQSDEPALLFILGGQTLTLGVLNAVIVYLTQRLGPAVVAHMVFNGISVATLLLVNSAA
jgi:membrane protease YdiL (CAAX protease family)